MGHWSGAAGQRAENRVIPTEHVHDRRHDGPQPRVKSQPSLLPY